MYTRVIIIALYKRAISFRGRESPSGRATLTQGHWPNGFRGRKMPPPGTEPADRPAVVKSGAEEGARLAARRADVVRRPRGGALEWLAAFVSFKRQRPRAKLATYILHSDFNPSGVARSAVETGAEMMRDEESGAESSPCAFTLPTAYFG